MNGFLKFLIFSLSIFLLEACSSDLPTAQSSDWPQWWGPKRDGIWHEDFQIDTLRKENVKKVWEMPIRPGYSGPTVAEGRVYVMDYDEEAEVERVLCFDVDSGKELWVHSYTSAYSKVGYPTGPRASVLVHEGKAYSLGTMGHLYCLDSKTGEILWQHNGLEEYNSRIPIWGLASSPILEKDKLIVQLGGEPNACLVAFDKDSGKEVWRALKDDASYSAPIVIEQGGKRVLVCWTGDNIVGLNPENGETYWIVPYQKQKMIINISTPVYSPPYLFVSSFYDGSFLLRLNQETPEAELVWYRIGESERKTDALHCCISTPIIEGDYIYGIDSYGEARCLDLKTGDRIWEDRTLVRQGRWSNVHFIRHKDKYWGLNEEGMLMLGKFTPQGYQDLGKVKLINPAPVSPNPRKGVIWAHPAYSGRKIYVRSDEKIACFGLDLQ